MTSGPSENFWPERPPCVCRVCDSFVPKFRNNLESNSFPVNLTAVLQVGAGRSSVTPVKSQSLSQAVEERVTGLKVKTGAGSRARRVRNSQRVCEISLVGPPRCRRVSSISPRVISCRSALTSTFPSYLPSDHQGDVSARRPPCDLQPGGGSGARDQHAGAVLRQAQPGRRLGVHPGGREPRLRDDTLLHAAGASPERRRRAARVLHHRLRQRDR